MICMECLSESDKGGRADVKNYDEDFTVSCDKPALACGMCVLCSCRPVRHSIPAGGRSFHTLRCFELWLRIGAMGSRSKDDYRRDSFPGNTDSRYVPDCRHRIAKDLYPDDLRNSRDTTGAYPERVCPVLALFFHRFQNIIMHCPHAWTGNLSLIEYQNGERGRCSRKDTPLAGNRRFPGDLLSVAAV